MKYSGIEWIGSIPDNWKLVRLKDIYSYKKEIVGNKSFEFERLALTLNGVIKRAKDDSDGLQPKEFDSYQIIRSNDLVFKMIDLQNISTSRVGLSSFDGLVSPAYIRFVPRYENQFNDYIYYYLLSMWHNCVFNSLGGDGVRSSLSSFDMGNMICPFPSTQTQIKIMNFIKNQESNVNTLIENEKAQIDKLKEFRQSVITETVKKGLNKNSRMKRGGVDWIGDINNEYKIVPLKFLLKEQMMYGANESGQLEKTTNCYRYIRITDIDDNGILKDGNDNQYLANEVGTPYCLEEGDVLFARSGGTVGKTFIYHNSYGRCAFAGYLIKGKSDKTKLLPEYLYLYTQSSIYELWKQQIFIQATIQNIGANKYSMLPVVCGSIEEQNKIADYVRKKCSEIDRLIVLKQNKIDKLNEYKKSLIYEYITGKKEVANG